MRKKQGMGREAFIAYYETRHAPLIQSLLPNLLAYRRNFVAREGAFESAVAAIDFDSVTEMHFATHAPYDAFLTKAARPEVASLIAQDEENLFDRASTRMFVVEETPAGAQAAADASTLLVDRELREGLARFARVLDTKQWNALCANMRRFLDVCGPTQHLIGSISIDVAPRADRATSLAYVQARHQRADDLGGPIFDTCGEYLDQWVLRPEGWRIARREARWLVNSGEASIIWG